MEKITVEQNRALHILGRRRARQLEAKGAREAALRGPQFEITWLEAWGRGLSMGIDEMTDGLVYEEDGN